MTLRTELILEFVETVILPLFPLVTLPVESSKSILTGKLLLDLSPRVIFS